MVRATAGAIPIPTVAPAVWGMENSETPVYMVWVATRGASPALEALPWLEEPWKPTRGSPVARLASAIVRTEA